MTTDRSTVSPLRRLSLAIAALLALTACTPSVSAPTPPPATKQAGQPAATSPAVVAVATPTSAPTATTTPATPTVAPTATAQPRAEQGNIVWVLQGDLWTISPDGKNEKRLTNDGGYSTPRWSPDASRLVFVQGVGKQARLGLMNADGSGKRLLAGFPSAGDTDPVWSPRGNAIAFVRTPDTNGDGNLDLRDEAEVWLVDGDGKNPRRLALGRDPAWAPEGLRLAYATNGVLSGAPPYRHGNAINVINSQGQNEWTLLTVDKVPAQIKVGDFTLSPATNLLKEPAWRPDGERIALTTNGHTGLVLTISLKATDLQVIDTSYEGGFGRALWSPLGDLLAYEAQPPSGVGEIGVADAARNKVAALGGVRKGLHITEIAWAPDGAQLAFAQVEAEPYLGSAPPVGASVKPIYWGPSRWPDWGRKR